MSCTDSTSGNDPIITWEFFTEYTKVSFDNDLDEPFRIELPNEGAVENQYANISNAFTDFGVTTWTGTISEGWINQNQTATSENFAMAWDESDNKLFVGSTDQDIVYKLDPTTGAHVVFAPSVPVWGGDLVVNGDQIL